MWLYCNVLHFCFDWVLYSHVQLWHRPDGAFPLHDLLALPLASGGPCDSCLVLGFFRTPYDLYVFCVRSFLSMRCPIRSLCRPLSKMGVALMLSAVHVHCMLLHVCTFFFLSSSSINSVFEAFRWPTVFLVGLLRSFYLPACCSLTPFYLWGSKAFFFNICFGLVHEQVLLPLARAACSLLPLAWAACTLR